MQEGAIPVGTEPRDFAPVPLESLPGQQWTRSEQELLDLLVFGSLLSSGVSILVEETEQVGTSRGYLFWKQRVKRGDSNAAVFVGPPGLLRLAFFVC